MEMDSEPKDRPDRLIEAKQRNLVNGKRRCGQILVKQEAMQCIE